MKDDTLMKDDTRVVQIGGKTYAEGLLEHEVQDRYRGITPGGLAHELSSRISAWA
jgi:hypothetical protein